MRTALRPLWARWLARRIPPAASVRLNQRRIFIVPSRDLIVVRLALMEENDANWEADLQWNLALARAFP